MKNSKAILFSAMMVVLLTVAMIEGCSKPKDNNNNRPEACFTASSDSIRTIDTVTVNALCSQEAVSYSWVATLSAHISSATGNTASFKPVGPGILEITLIATNTEGVDSTTKSINVRQLYPSDYVGAYTCNDSCADNTTYGPYNVTIDLGSNPQSLQLTGYFTSPTNVQFNMSAGVFQHTDAGVSFYGYLQDANKLEVSYQLNPGAVGCLSTCRRN